MTNNLNGNREERGGSKRRTRVVRPYPMHTLEDALEVAATIQSANAGLPFDRALLARALGTTPASSVYTLKLNSSAKYGLTEGGYSDELISLTPRGQAIVAPKDDAELRKARTEAAMSPEVFGKFYRMLNGKQLPEDAYARNLLQREFEVHQDLAGECLSIAKANGAFAGIIAEQDGALVVNVSAPRQASRPPAPPEAPQQTVEAKPSVRLEPASAHEASKPRGKIFLSGSADAQAVRYVKSVLNQFGIPFATADGDQMGPLSYETLRVMKGCTAAVLVFDGEGLNAKDGAGPPVNEWMMYRVGAASALYGNKVIVVERDDAGRTPLISAFHRSVTFDNPNSGRVGLALLVNLYEAGVISVTA